LVYELVHEHGFMSLFKADLTEKLTSWDPFSHQSTPWFNPEWMFGIRDGFDIIIANPHGYLQERANLVNLIRSTLQITISAQKGK